jgi:hypothetical protein
MGKPVGNVLFRQPLSAALPRAILLLVIDLARDLFRKD